MARRKFVDAILGGSLVLALSPIVGASVISGTLIYSDSFSNTTGSPQLLNGHTPDLADAYGASWVSATALGSAGAAPDALFMIPTGGGMTTVTDGAADPTTTEDTSTIVDAYLPITVVAGTKYDLSVSMAVPTVNSGGHGAEMAFIDSSNFNGHNGPTIASNGTFGSTVYPDTGDGSGALNNLNSYGLILQKDTDVVQMFAGKNTANQNSGTLTDTSTSFNTFDILLDTTGAQWSISQYLNGTLENSATFSTNPSIGFIGLAVNRTSGEFDFSLTALPEPTSASLLALGTLLLAKRRRNRAVV
jgi:hypothetical protein